MNKVILTGHLCRDIELKTTASDKSVATNSVAVQREYKNANGEYDSDFINIVVWGNQAEYLNKYAKKGDRVELVGRWNVRKYEDASGETKTVNECVVESIKAFTKQPKGNETKDDKNNLKPVEDEDLPF